MELVLCIHYSIKKESRLKDPIVIKRKADFVTKKDDRTTVSAGGGWVSTP